MKQSFKYFITLILVACIGIVFYLKVYIPKSTYEVISPIIGYMDVSIKGIGKVSALNIYSITAQGGGKILEILKDDGDWVKRGDLLIVVDGVDLFEQLEVAKANLNKTKFDSLAAKSELSNQQAQRELFKVTYNRYKKLKEQGFASLSEYDKANMDLKSSNANIAISQAKINSANAAAEVALKNVNAVKARIDRLKIYSPVDGYVISKDAEVSQSVLASTSILKLVDPTTLWVQTKIDERISSKIALNQKASIHLRSQPDKIYEGIVKRVSSMSDSVTLEREVNVAFRTIPKPFYINEQAEVIITVESFHNVLKIPSSVVVQRKGKLGIWLLKDGHAKFLKIKKIAQSDKEVAISNIDANSKIIVPNPSKKNLNDGMKIHL
ncbi:MAG: RND family efflux transporter MFP subunit [Sulfurimonas sp.]|jgi:RND family efflux transporter MFP subunit